MDGYSNLTQAIQEGADIDWERLARRKVKITHPEEVEVAGYMSPDPELSQAGKLHLPSAWTLGASLDGWTNRFLHEAFHGSRGFELYIAGGIPLKTCTADKLKPGSVFKGKCPNGETQEFLVAYSEDGGACLIESDIFKALAEYTPNQVEVVEVLSGGFQATKEEA